MSSAAHKLFPRTQGVTELHLFLGSLNFYRSYTPELAHLSVPYTNGDEKGLARFEIVKADASTTAVAAVLSQRNEETGQLHPIDYFSSSLSGAQRNYSAGQLEAWALVSVCRKWQTYLGTSGSVDLITDHCPLKWLRDQKDPRRTFARWILELEEYSYTITHRPVKKTTCQTI